jgi:hypothetical protein
MQFSKSVIHAESLGTPHITALKGILRYIHGTLNLGLHLYKTSPIGLVVYSDADWASCPETRKSTSGYMQFSSVTISFPGP